MDTVIQGTDEKKQLIPGMRVVITQAPDQYPELSEQLRGLGAEVLFYPCVEIMPISDNQELESALREAASGKFDWIVLNYAETVVVLANQMREMDLDPRHLDNLKVATIGCMTELVTQRLLGLQADFAPENYTPQIVAEAMQLNVGDRVLLPQSARTRLRLARCLRETGADVTAVNSYRAIIGHGGDPVPVMLWEGSIDAITFTSPEDVRYFSRRLKHEGGSLAMLDDVCVACLGPITAATAVEYGLKVSVQPAQHTIQGLVDATSAYFTLASK